MKTLKCVVLFIILSTLFGCSRQFYVAKLIPGESIIEDATMHLGRPASFDDSAGRQTVRWNDVTIQARDEVIEVVQRAPAHYETSLQFWRQHYKSSPQRFEKVQAGVSLGEHLWQLNLPKEKINIVYDETKDKVIKVMYYVD